MVLVASVALGDALLIEMEFAVEVAIFGADVHVGGGLRAAGSQESVAACGAIVTTKPPNRPKRKESKPGEKNKKRNQQTIKTIKTRNLSLNLATAKFCSSLPETLHFKHAG